MRTAKWESPRNQWDTCRTFKTSTNQCYQSFVPRGVVQAFGHLDKTCVYPITKTGDAQDCGTIALITYASQILLKVFQQRLQQVTDQELADVQAGFRKGRDTRSHFQYQMDHWKDPWVVKICKCVLFDWVENKLWVARRDHSLIKLIKSLCKHFTVMQIGSGSSKGTRQGCSLS